MAVLALALGIGANTVLFSAINTLFFRPLSFPSPEKLVRVWGSFPERGLDRANVSWPRFCAWRDQQQSFSDFAAQAFTGFTMTGRGDPENLQGIRVTSNFLPALGVEPLFGRTFTADDDRPGGPNVILVSHTFWQKRFGGDRNILGQALVLNGTPFTVIGVMPHDGEVPLRPESGLVAARVRGGRVAARHHSKRHRLSLNSWSTEIRSESATS